MTTSSPTRESCRRYYAALPRRGRSNLRVRATGGAKGLLTTIVPWCLPALGAMLGAAAAHLTLSGAYWAAGLVGAHAGFMLGAAAGFILIRQVEVAAIVDFLRSQTQGGRLASCPGCEYDLRGASSSRCPECGCPVRVGDVRSQVSSTRPDRRATEWQPGGEYPA